MIRLAGYIPDVDMKIEFIGQRPGEKLFEEVFSKNELIKETHNEKIMISGEKGFSQSEAENIIKQLKTLDKCYEPELFRINIKNLIPEYKYFMDTNNTFINFNTKKKLSNYKFQN